MGHIFNARTVQALLRRSGLHALVERYHHELEQHEQAQQVLRSWKSWLLRARASPVYPVVVALLAVISAGTATYPYSPVLIAAVVFAPQRWRVIYVAAALGAATGAGLLAMALQSVGDLALATLFSGFELSPRWADMQQWVAAYGSLALALIAALPVPEMPALLTLIVAKTPPGQIWLAVLAGKLVKYGLYIAVVLGLLRAIKRRRAAR